MTLEDLVSTLVARQALPSGRVKDIRTAITYLATALGTDGPAQCLVDVAKQEVDAGLPALGTYFQTLETDGHVLSAKTRSNHRGNLRLLLRAAEAQGLTTAPLRAPLRPLPTRAVVSLQQRETALYPGVWHAPSPARNYGLHQAEWPPDIVAGWQAYLARRSRRLRDVTVRGHAQRLESYLGYIAHIKGAAPSWEGCFVPATINEFLTWNAKRVGRTSISTFGHAVVQTLAAIAKVLERSDARALADFRNELPIPARLHNKDLHWVSLAQLDAVADACLRLGRAPLVGHEGRQHAGRYRASTFQRGVMLKLLVRVPLRQRNLRELRLGPNLYQDRKPQGQKGDWHVRFQGDELKIRERRGEINTYHINLTEETDGFVPVLEEFLETYRPRMHGSATWKHLFLTISGRPFVADSLYSELADTVYQHTGQHFYPHLIRSIWATEYITATGDVVTAAHMLGDTVQVVLKDYNEVIERVHKAKAKDFLAKALKPPGAATDEAAD